MKVIGISGSNVGTKTKTAMTVVEASMKEKYPEVEFELIDLAEVQMVFGDGRNYQEYEGDTKYVTEKIMAADALIIGTPTFQASIPASLKNIFDLLPINAFRDKVVSMIGTAGTPKHFLMLEQQLKPILAYMKATIVPTYVFIEEKDFYRNKIVNEDILFRIERLVEDTIMINDAFAEIRKKKDEEYGF